MGISRYRFELPRPQEALPGRAVALAIPERHLVTGAALAPPYPAGHDWVVFGLGCFWGAERRFWQIPGVLVTAVGYAGGHTPNPTYEEVCSGRTGHAEVVRVVFEPARVGFGSLLEVFFESHDPTQGMRQGNDIGTQYRSVIFCRDAMQRQIALEAKRVYGDVLVTAGFGAVTTEIADAPEFYFAEDYHQQYLARNPNGYCGLAGTGIACPTGTASAT